MTELPVLRIDFVSDIACPWCTVGFAGLRTAAMRLADRMQLDIHLQPFELEPDMPFDGIDAAAHLMRKYGMDEAQLEVNRAALRERAAAAGVTIRHGADARVWNTFDAHRLLHWAGLQDNDRALALQQLLFDAYHVTHENVADHEILVRLAAAVGLDAQTARTMLAGTEHGDEIRARERWAHSSGIHSVPAVIIDERYKVSGGQPADVFEQALLQAAAARTSAERP